MRLKMQPLRTLAVRCKSDEGELVSTQEDEDKGKRYVEYGDYCVMRSLPKYDAETDETRMEIEVLSGAGMNKDNEII